MKTPNADAIAYFNHYLSKGIARIPAAGMIGVFNYESGLNPNSENNSGSETPGAINLKGSFGFEQLNGERQNNFLKFCQSKGGQPTDPLMQLDFALTESANSYSAVWAAIQAGDNQTLEQFCAIFVEKYEIPKTPTPEIASAVAFGNLLLALPQDAPAPSPAPVPTPAPMPVPAPAPVPAPLTRDPEIYAIETSAQAFDALTPAAAKRVVAWLTARYAGGA